MLIFEGRYMMIFLKILKIFMVKKIRVYVIEGCFKIIIKSWLIWNVFCENIFLENFSLMVKM